MVLCEKKYVKNNKNLEKSGILWEFVWWHLESMSRTGSTRKMKNMIFRFIYKEKKLTICRKSLRQSYICSLRIKSARCKREIFEFTPNFVFEMHFSFTHSTQIPKLSRPYRGELFPPSKPSVPLPPSHPQDKFQFLKKLVISKNLLKKLGF